MTRAAFEWSERFNVPVLVRVVTRLCHGRAEIQTRPPTQPRDPNKFKDARDWTLLPANARRLWGELLETQKAVRGFVELQTCRVRCIYRSQIAASCHAFTAISGRTTRQIYLALSGRMSSIVWGSGALPVA